MRGGGCVVDVLVQGASYRRQCRIWFPGARGADVEVALGLRWTRFWVSMIAIERQSCGEQQATQG